MLRGNNDMPTIRAVVALTILISTALPCTVNATGSPLPLISELMTATSASASQEFIELYNPSAMAVPLTGWTIEYKSATSADITTSWSKKATLTASIPGYGFYLIAPKESYPLADLNWTGAMAASAGVIRLKNDAGVVIDTLGYGSTAIGAETLPAAAPATGQSIERLPGRLSETRGNDQDTNSNALDFIIRQVPDPQTTASPVEHNDTPTADNIDTSVTDDVPTYLPLLITELLPNPMSPLTDSEDEFIELYNPNDVAVDVTGYKLQGGTNFRGSYTLTSQSVASHAYLLLTSSQTHISLTNSGGAVRLLDPEGALLDQSADYDAADDGLSWSLVNDIWQWSLQTTPGQPNQLVVPIIASPATNKAATPKKAAAKKATPAKPKASKTPAKPKVAKPKAAKKPTTKIPIQVAAASVRLSTWLIIALAIFTIGYACYEFRDDIHHYYRKLRRHPKLGARVGAPTQRGRDD
jgi:hypothetical protein